MARTTRKQYVTVTYRLIQSEGLENISVRRIVSELHCTPGALYKHFESLDYLVALASVYVLKDYMIALEALSKEDNTIYSNLLAWKLLLRYAFQEPAVFYAVYFGPYSARMADVFRDFCEIFPELLERLSKSQLPIVMNHRLEERDVLGMAASIGKEIPDLETAKRLARLDSCIFRTLLLEGMEQEDAGKRQELAEECYQMMEHQAVLHMSKAGVVTE